MKLTKLSVALSLPGFLSACGDHLGEYRLDEIRVVREAAVDGRRLPAGTDYFRIVLSSETNLYVKDIIAGLYTEVDFCPLRNANRIIAFGPLSENDELVDDFKGSEDMKRTADGRYRYVIYIARNSPPRKALSNSAEVIPGYELRTGERNLCVRFFVPSYNLTPSHSGTVEIPAKTLAAATAA